MGISVYIVKVCEEMFSFLNFKKIYNKNVIHYSKKPVICEKNKIDNTVLFQIAEKIFTFTFLIL